jgi:hypothetical protein
VGLIRCENPARVVRPVIGSPVRDGPSWSRSRLRGAAGFGRKVASRKRAGGAWARAHAKLQPANPERAKPKGASGGCRTNPVAVVRDSRKGQSPEAAARWAGPGASAPGLPTGKTACGFIPAETRGYLPRGESSEGRIPRAPPARNKAGTGSEGVSRREGHQTLRAERSGCCGRPRGKWTSKPSCAEGNEKPKRGADRLWLVG